MFDTNPSAIYEVDEGVPLVLMHDGGGTCFSYWCLNPIGRTVYGIHNPHYHSGEGWPGGIPEMARYYVALLRRIVPHGPVLLGGWSLGGLLAVEMAHMLRHDPRIRVVGIVMVDSISPLAFHRPSDVPVVPYKQQWGPHTKEETKARVDRCFVEARKAVGQYELPVWTPSSSDTDDSTPSTPGRGPSQFSGPPPVILLRAKERVQVEEGTVCHVDVARDDRLLGWGGYREDLIRQVVDVEGHHFNIFALQHIEAVSEKIQEACLKLEALSSS